MGEARLPYFALTDFRPVRQLTELLEEAKLYHTSDANLYLLLLAPFFSKSQQILLNPV